MSARDGENGTSVVSLRTGPAGAAATMSDRRALRFVALAFVASVVIHAAAGLTTSAPWIIPDELIYSELAKSIADGSLPAVRGETTLGYGPVQPLVMAPAWAIFDDPGAAYQLARVIAAVVMSAAAFPAFFLARRFVSARSALIVAAFSVFIPAMLRTGTLLVEPVLYPIFLVALLAMVAALQAPSRRNQILVIGAIALASATKPLSLVLAPAYVLAVLQLAVLDRGRGARLRDGVRAHAIALGLLGAGAAVAVLAPAAAGNPTAVLGVYGVVLGNVDLGGTLVWFVRHLAGVDLYVAIVPFAATLVLVVRSLTRQADRRVDELAALALWTIGGSVAVVAAYASEPLAGASGYFPTEARLHGRNLSALVPVLLVGLALYLERGRPGSRLLRWSAVAVCVLLPVSLPLARLTENANVQAMVVIPWTAGGLARYWPLTLVPLAATVCWVTASPVARAARRSWLLVAVGFGLTTIAAYASMSHPDSGARSTVGIGHDRRWIDHAVPASADMLGLWVPPAAYRTIWMSEFFNRTVGTVVETGEPMPYDLPHVEGSIDHGVLRDAAGMPITARFVLAPCRVVVGVVASDPRVDALVYRVPAGPIRVAPRRTGDPSCGPDEASS